MLTHQWHLCEGSTKGLLMVLLLLLLLLPVPLR
jgi:hypothetical protein